MALACAILAPGPASGQEQCSCADKNPATAVTLQITAAVPEDHSRIGPQQETLVVDLRGTETVLVGEAPELPAGAEAADAPDEAIWEDGLVFAGAVLAALALLCLVLALTAGANPLVDDAPPTDASSADPSAPLP